MHRNLDQIPDATPRVVSAYHEATRFGYCLADISLPQGNLNVTIPVYSPDGQLGVLRIPSLTQAGVVKEYAISLYSQLSHPYGLPRLSIRNATQHSTFVSMLEAMGLPVARVMCIGDDWAIYEYVDGKTVNECLMGSDGEHIVASFLDALKLCHMHGVQLWDRWGGNEIYDTHNGIVFIDFDLSLTQDSDVSDRLLRTIDLAIAVRCCVQASRRNGLVAAAVINWLKLELSQGVLYDVPHLLIALVSVEGSLARQRRNELRAGVLHGDGSSLSALRKIVRIVLDGR